MSGSGSGKIPETSAQVALAQNAAQRFADYQTRWLPVQQNLASQIEAEGKTGSWQRQEAMGKATTDSAAQFANAREQLTGNLAAHGVAPGSGRSVLGLSGLGGNEARSAGLGSAMSDERITQAYTQGLGALMSVGQGQSAQAASGMEGLARDSAVQAQADAQAGLENTEDKVGLGMSGLGTGLGQLAAPGGMDAAKGFFGITGAGSNPMGFGGTMNNPSAFVNTGGGL